MTIPTDLKDRAIYHTILSDLHRVQSILLNLRTLDEPSTAEGLRDHFSREQGLVLARLSEWRQRRSEVYREAQADFATQVGAGTESEPQT